MSRALRVVLLGAPGSGKGTVASRVVRDFGLTHVSSGDALREQGQRDTETGRLVQGYMRQGQLVPDDLVVKMVVDQLASRDNWLLDGFPRTLAQALALHQHQTPEAVVHLDVPDEVIIERISGRMIHLPSGRIYHTSFQPPRLPGLDDVTGEKLHQREDDRLESVMTRLKHYHSLARPLVDLYHSLDLLQTFHGTETNEIYPRVHKYLSGYIPPLGGPF